MKISLRLFICLILLSAVSISAQTARDRGIELYKNGDYNGAIEILKSIVKIKQN